MRSTLRILKNIILHPIMCWRIGALTITVERAKRENAAIREQLNKVKTDLVITRARTTHTRRLISKQERRTAQ